MSLRAKLHSTAVGRFARHRRCTNQGSWTAYDARNAAYHAVFAGAAGHTFGNTSVHLSYDPDRFPNVGSGQPVSKLYPDIGGS